MSSASPERQAFLCRSCPKNAENLRQITCYCRQVSLHIVLRILQLRYPLCFFENSCLSYGTVILCLHPLRSFRFDEVAIRAIRLLAHLPDDSRVPAQSFPVVLATTLQVFCPTGWQVPQDIRRHLLPEVLGLSGPNGAGKPVSSESAQRSLARSRS
jgi:hypothetical protein